MIEAPYANRIDTYLKVGFGNKINEKCRQIAQIERAAHDAAQRLDQELMRLQEDLRSDVKELASLLEIGEPSTQGTTREHLLAGFLKPYRDLASQVVWSMDDSTSWHWESAALYQLKPPIVRDCSRLDVRKTTGLTDYSRASEQALEYICKRLHNDIKDAFCEDSWSVTVSGRYVFFEAANNPEGEARYARTNDAQATLCQQADIIEYISDIAGDPGGAASIVAELRKLGKQWILNGCLFEGKALKANDSGYSLHYVNGSLYVEMPPKDSETIRDLITSAQQVTQIYIEENGDE